MADGTALAGKVAIVTGSGKNIGKCIAEALVADGAAVVINGRSDRAIVENTANAISQAGGRAMPFIADISRPDAVGDLDGPCSVEIIRREDDGMLLAGSDPRRDGWALAW